MKKISLLFLLLVPIFSQFGKVEIIEISPETVTQLPQGKEADGIIGDFVLRNELIECAIGSSAPDRKANMGAFWGANGMTPGCLYDLCLRGTENDQLTIFSPSRQQGEISYIRKTESGDGIEVVTTAAKSGGLFKKHLYTIQEGEYGIHILSLIRNEGKIKVSGPIDDRWTRFRESGRLENIEWADSVDPADKAGYAYGWYRDKNGKLPPRSKTLHPGDQIEIKRFIAVGTSPVQALGRVAQKMGKTGIVEITLQEDSSTPISSATFKFSQNEQSISGYPDESGKISTQLPIGKWMVSILDHGRENQSFSIDVQESGVRKNCTMKPASKIDFSITNESGEDMPCKVQLIGLGETSDPQLGPVDRAHGCNNQYHSETGTFSIALNPGSYRIIVTRGIEFDHFEKEITLSPQETLPFSTKLKRTVNTKGWVSTDFHNHSTPSGDNVCGTNDRIINLAAEHIEFAPTTEHNRVYDWQPHIEELKLTKEISTVPGIELTGSGAHLNAFPITPSPYLQDNGSPKWVKDPRINAINLRDHHGHKKNRWIHINHPDMVENFNDRNKDGHSDNGFEGIVSLIDAIETQNYRASEILGRAPYQITRRASREQVSIIREFVWLQMLNQGRRVWGIAVSDAHTVFGNGVGGWRTYIPSSTDNPQEIDWEEISRRAKAGQMMLTTGPFLEVETQDGILPGGLARANDSIQLNVRVQCSSWIDINRVQILINGRQSTKYNYTRKTHPHWFKDEVVKFDQLLTIELSHDAHLIVVAYGEELNLKTGYGNSGQGTNKPCAYHNPIFVDTNGDGFTPNGDTLGFPIPTAGMSVEQVKEKLIQAGITTQ